MSNIELPPPPSPQERGAFSLVQLQAYARAAVELNASVATSADVEAMAQWLEGLRMNKADEAAAMLRSLEAMVISKQIQIDTLEMLRERDAPPSGQYPILPPPATTSNSSGDSSSKASITGTSTASTSTGFSMDAAPVRTGEVPSVGTINQYHEPGLGLNKGDY